MKDENSFKLIPAFNIKVSYGFASTNMFLLRTMSLFVTPCHFLLAQKVTNPERFREPNASARKPARPSLGKEAHAFLLASASHCALVFNIDNQYLINV